MDDETVLVTGGAAGIGRAKQDLGLEDCELRHAAGASRHWHLLMLAYSLLKLGAADSALNDSRTREFTSQQYQTLLP